MTRSRITVRRKLITAMMLTSTIVVLLTGASLVTYDIVSTRERYVTGLTTRASILAANSTAALAFENPDDAREVLGALRFDPSTVSAALYDRDGRLFATYPAALDPSKLPRTSEPPGHRFRRASIVVTVPVVQAGRALGVVRIESNLSALAQRMRVFVLVVLLAVFGSIGVAFALAAWLQAGITRPVRTLADAARRISETKDYSVRAHVVSDDELGPMADSFNQMLDEIQQRDTALRASEARLRATLESALDCIVTMDHDGRVVDFNPASEKLFGYPRATSVGKPLAELIVPPAHREAHRQGLARYLATGESRVLNRRLELSAVTADGREIPVEVAITRIPHDGPATFTGFIRDITERKRAEQEIRQLNTDLERRVAARTAELEALNRELESFTYSVSHDLRSPLRHIEGFAELLTRHVSDTLDAKGRRYLGMISDSARGMGVLIDDLLSFSRMSRSELNHASVDLAELVTEARHALELETQGRGVAWRIEPLPTVVGDRPMLRQVVMNLVSNAIKYTRGRTPARIRVGATEDEREIVLFVRDNGAGFDMQYAHKLFGVFQRLHGSDEFEGTGIGLANVRRIVQRHGGRVWAEGVVGEGATFFVALPRTAETADASREAA